MTGTVEAVERLLPRGSVAGATRSIRRCPNWPPDLFAVAATLVEANGLYAQPRFTHGWDPGRYAFDDEYVADVKAIGRKWLLTAEPPQELRRLWKTLLDRDRPGGQAGTDHGHHAVLLKLMAIADEASSSIGFLPDLTGEDPFFSCSSRR